MIYFDHAAAVPILPEVSSSYPVLLERYSGNPEAAHQLGHTLNKELENLGKMLFDTLLPQARVEQKNCFFAGDTTGLLNILQYAYGDTAATAWSSPLEHVSVKTMLQRSFGKVCHLPLDGSGKISNLPEDIAGAKFIVITHVQSEIGVMQDITELMPKLRSAAPRAVILLDMVQSNMVYDFPATALLPDLLLVSGAKMGSNSGAALLAMGKAAGLLKDKLHTLRHKLYCIGRSNIVEAAALVLASQVNAVQRVENFSLICRINRFLREKLNGMVLPNGKKCRLTVPASDSAVNILHLILPGYQAGVLVRMFSAKNIMLSSGSACQSESDEPSAVLTALGYSKSDSYSGLRISISGENTLQEAEIFVETLKDILQNY